jgi:hypothetical protein
MRLLGLVFGAGLLGLGMAALILLLAPSVAPHAATVSEGQTRSATPTRLALLEPPAPRRSPDLPWSPRARRRRLRRDRSLRAVWREVCRRFPGPEDADLIVVDIRTETLTLLHHGRIVHAWPVSTALRGADQVANSDGTPIGVFRVARKIGAGLPPDEVLRDQVPTGRFVAPVRVADDPTASRWITTRILWLSGLQPGWNEGGDDDTFRRHIYIHGTADLGMLGRPASQGCVQMAPRAVIALYRAVPAGTPVLITPGTQPLAELPGPAMG